MKLLPSAPTIKSQTKKISADSIRGDEKGGGLYVSKKKLISIKSRVIKIEKLLGGQNKLYERQKKKSLVEEEKKTREKQESKLEKPKEKEDDKDSKKLLKGPKLGFLDRIKNFIGKVLLGFIAVRLVPYLPKLLEFFPKVISVVDWVTDVGIGFIDGLGSFVKSAYELRTKTLGFIKDFGGDFALNLFSKFEGAVGKVIEAAIIIAMSSGGEGGLLETGLDLVKDRFAGQAASNVAGQAGRTAGMGAGAAAAIVAGAGLLASAAGEGAFQLRSKGREIEGGAKKNYEQHKDKWKIDPRRVLSWGLYQAARFGNTLLSTVGFLLDVVGAPFRYAVELIRYPFLNEEDKKKQATNLAKFDARIREDLRKALNMVTFGAAFKEKGSFGNMFGNDDAQKEMMSKMAGGGVTRGGRAQTGVRRGIRQEKTYKREIVKKPTPTKFETEDKTLKETSQNLDKTKYFGPILAVSAKVLNKEKPTQQDYNNVGLGLNLLISKGIEQQQLKGGLVAAFAEGGMVNEDFLEAAEKGSDISDWVAKTFKTEFERDLQKTLNLIDKGKEGPDKSDPTLTTPDDGTPSGSLTEGQWGPLLDLIAGKESGGNYEAMYPSTTLKGATKMTIAEVARRATGAVGKYQQLPQYLVGRAKAAGLNPDSDLYSPENQEKIIINVNIKGRGGEKWLKGEITTEQFMQGLSQEFASLPNAQGKFYYSGQSSAMTPEKIKAALAKVKGGGYSQQEIAASKVESGPLGTGKASSVDQFNTIAKKYGLSITSAYRRGDRGYHGKNRARDYSNDGVGRGTPQQLAFAKEMIKQYGSALTQLIYTPLGFGIANGKRVGLDYWGPATNSIHYDHVHVALAKGGKVKKITRAIIGEKGPEFVIDTDSTKALEDNFPGFLDALNHAKYDQAIGVLRNYASYEAGATQQVQVPINIINNIVKSQSKSTPSMVSVGGGSIDDYSEALAAGQ